MVDLTGQASPNQPGSRLRGVDWLVLSRLVVLVVVFTCLVIYLSRLGSYYHVLATPSDLLLQDFGWTVNQLHQALTLAGHSIQLHALYQTSLMAIFGIVFSAVSLLLIWFKPRDRMAIITAFILSLFGTGLPPVMTTAALLTPQFSLPIEIWANLGFIFLFLLFFIFPDGRFIPRWTLIPAVLWVGINLVIMFLPDGPLNLFYISTPLGVGTAMLFIGLFIFAQIYRYRRVSNVIQRQQTRWVVVGMIGALFCFAATWAFGIIFPSFMQPTTQGAVFNEVLGLVYTVAFIQIPITLGIAITRYHLWDIDLLLRRTVVYAILTACLVLVYFGSVVLLTNLSAGKTSSWYTALATLAIAALFNPLRRSLQKGIDKRFHRSRLNAMDALVMFSSRIQAGMDPAQMESALLKVVVDSYQPALAGVWLKPLREGSPQRATRQPLRNDLETPHP